MRKGQTERQEGEEIRDEDQTGARRRTKVTGDNKTGGKTQGGK